MLEIQPMLERSPTRFSGGSAWIQNEYVGIVTLEYNRYYWMVVKNKPKARGFFYKLDVSGGRISLSTKPDGKGVVTTVSVSEILDIE